MSVNRLFLRTAAVAALRPASGEIWPTMAGMRVHDSRLDPIEYTDERSEIPLIAVYTDDDEGRPAVSSLPGKVLVRNVVLRVEFALGMWGTETIDNEEHSVFYTPTLEPELEAQLDIFEQQIRWALFSRFWRPGTAVFLKFVKAVHSIQSLIQRDEETNTKISARRLLISIDMPDDCPPTVFLGSEPEGPPRRFDFSAFPGAPWLADMLNAMSNDKVSHPVLDVLGNSQQAAIYLPLLKTIGMKVDAADPADPNRLANLGRAQGPDGRVELAGTWSTQR